MRLVLDTSAYSRMRGGDARVLDLVARAEVVYLPTIVLGELEAAFQLGQRAEANRVVLREFLSESFAAVLPVTADVAQVYGRVFSELRRAGTPISVNDVWIAAATIDAGGHLVAFDRDFERIARLERTILS